MVDNELKVIGVQGLRVCDAIVMSEHVSGNILASVVAVAERLAELVNLEYIQKAKLWIYDEYCYN